MKRIMKGLFAVLLILALTTGVLTACKNNDGEFNATIVETSDTMVVIKVDEVNGNVTLMTVMEKLKQNGQLSFTIIGGMISEINGIANDADYNPCWMLYTSDTELANQAWGTVEYNGTVYGSAIVGAEALSVVNGGYYVWSYQTFSY